MTTRTFRGKPFTGQRSGHYIEMHDGWMWCHRCNDPSGTRECMDSMYGGCSYIRLENLDEAPRRHPNQIILH